MFDFTLLSGLVMFVATVIFAIFMATCYDDHGSAPDYVDEFVVHGRRVRVRNDGVLVS